MQRVLLAWVGLMDLRCSRGEEEGEGPIATAVLAESFRAIHLLSNDHETEAKAFADWLRTKTAAPVAVHPRRLPKRNVIDHGAIYQETLPVIEAVLERYGVDVPLVFHLSPGTPAMHAVWVLLGKSKFPAALIQTTKGQLGFAEANIPFDIATDFRDVLKNRDDRLRQLLEGSFPVSEAANAILHDCVAMKEALALAARAAVRNTPVLILGESGTGKELLAALIHEESGRTGSLVRVNSGGIPKDLLNSELFGYEKGAFTGADRQKTGYFDEARDGSLFLDEIGELSEDAQVRMLRVLQEHEFYRIGARKPLATNARVIAATHQNLLVRIEQGTFREDLFHRLAFAVIELPPLRERGMKDIDLLTDHFLEQLNRELAEGAAPGSSSKRLTPQARARIRSHRWPGNVRELQNTLARASLYSPGDKITLSDVERAILRFPGPGGSLLDLPLGDSFSLPKTLEEIEKNYIERALAEAKTQKAAAVLLGHKSPQALRYRMKSLGMT